MCKSGGTIREQCIFCLEFYKERRCILAILFWNGMIFSHVSFYEYFRINYRMIHNLLMWIPFTVVSYIHVGCCSPVQQHPSFGLATLYGKAARSCLNWSRAWIVYIPLTYISNTPGAPVTCARKPSLSFDLKVLTNKKGKGTIDMPDILSTTPLWPEIYPTSKTIYKTM